MQTAIGLLQLVPGVGGIAMGLSLGLSLIGEPSGPIVKIPHPFRQGSFLWGVPRRADELSLIAHYRIEAAPASGGVAAAGHAGEQSMPLPLAVQVLNGKTAGAVAAGTALLSTSQEPLYRLGAAYGPAKRTMALADVLWAEARRRGAVEASLAGRLLALEVPISKGLVVSEPPFAPGSLKPGGFGAAGQAQEAEVRITVVDVWAGAGWMDPYITGEGGEWGERIDAELSAARARVNAVTDPAFDDIDTRSWDAGGWLDTYQACAAVEGLDAVGSRSSWKAAKKGRAADARNLWDEAQLDELDRYEQRRELWEQWRALVQYQFDSKAAVATAQAQADQAFADLISMGYTPAQAASQVQLSSYLAQSEIMQPAAPAPGAAPAVSRGQLLTAAVAGLGAALLLLG